MPLKPIDLDFFYKSGKNVHEAIAIAAKRARQINEEQKIEFNQRVELITVKTEIEGEETDVNPDQLKISLEFEKRPKPTDLAVQELVAEQLEWRYKEKEEIPVAPEEAAGEPETGEGEE